MTIEEAQYIYLKSCAGIIAFVGQKIYPIKLPQGVSYPALTYRVISSPEIHDIDIAYPRFQYSCWSQGYGEAKMVANEVIKAFQRFKGIMGGTNGVKIKQCVILGKYDLYDSDTGIYHVPVDIQIIYMKE